MEPMRNDINFFFFYLDVFKSDHLMSMLLHLFLYGLCNEHYNNNNNKKATNQHSNNTTICNTGKKINLGSGTNQHNNNAIICNTGSGGYKVTVLDMHDCIIERMILGSSLTERSLDVTPSRELPLIVQSSSVKLILYYSKGVYKPLTIARNIGGHNKFGSFVHAIQRYISTLLHTENIQFCGREVDCQAVNINLLPCQNFRLSKCILSMQLTRTLKK